MIVKKHFLAVLLGTFAAAMAACTLRSLEYLQTEGDTGIDPVDGEGCPPESWSECGVTAIASAGAPTAVCASYGDKKFYYADAESGAIYVVGCPDSSCAAPVAEVTGEASPVEHLGCDGGYVWWTTSTEVRVVYVHESLDGGTVKTIDTVTMPTAVGSYSRAWSDAMGVRGTYSSALELVVYWQEPATALAPGGRGLVWISGGKVLTCAADKFGNGCEGGEAGVTPLGGVDGAELLANAGGFATGLLDTYKGGLLASVPTDGGSALVLVEQPDDAGVLPVVAETNSRIVALAASVDEVFFTTADGRLMLRKKDAAQVKTLLRGLSGSTRLAATDGNAFLVDRDKKLVLRVVP
jgi:hypothetical protein